MEKKYYSDILEGDLEEIQSYREVSIVANTLPDLSERVEIRDLINGTISVILPGDRPVQEVLAEIDTVARRKIAEVKETQGYVTLDAVELTKRMRESTKRLKTEDRFRTISMMPAEVLNQLAFEYGYTIESAQQNGAKINAVLSKDNIRFVVSICIAEYLDVTKSVKTYNIIREEIKDRLKEQIEVVGAII